MGRAKPAGHSRPPLRTLAKAGVPLAARSPARVPEWTARKREQIEDPHIVDFSLTLSGPSTEPTTARGWTGWTTLVLVAPRPGAAPR
ncbi:hypothetical protein [Microbispora bryophytorum]|uniref:hypothetical protein n=1 Tax=Microbispora bryophytorum TaxID=1460882 RepID=UPI0033D4900B